MLIMLVMPAGTPDAVRETVKATYDFGDVMKTWSDQLGEFLAGPAGPETRSLVLRRLAATAVTLVEVTASVARALDDAGLPTDDGGDRGTHYRDDDDLANLDEVIGAFERADSALNRIADRMVDDGADENRI